MKRVTYFTIVLTLSIWLGSCGGSDVPGPAASPTGASSGSGNLPIPTGGCAQGFEYSEQTACTGEVYPDPASSPYVLPFPAGETHSTGLTNCSSSFHARGNPDQLAYDFDMPAGSSFLAAREGIVVAMDESQPSEGGGGGNYVLVEHRDGTLAYYLHSPKNGIFVVVGQEVAQGQPLGEVGNSGQAGYPHLHFIVVKPPGRWPYEGIPVTFNNVVPNDVVLASYYRYKACD